MGYKILNFVKFLEGYRVLRAQNSNKNSRNKRREPLSRKLGKRRRQEEILSFPKPKNREELEDAP